MRGLADVLCSPHLTLALIVVRPIYWQSLPQAALGSQDVPRFFPVQRRMSCCVDSVRADLAPALHAPSETLFGSDVFLHGWRGKLSSDDMSLKFLGLLKHTLGGAFLSSVFF